MASPLSAATSSPSYARPLHVLAPAPVGGLESVVRMLAGAQVERGRAVTALLIVDAGAAPHPLTEALRGARIAVRELSVPPRAYRQERRELIQLCRAIAPSVVHTHGYRADVLAASAARAAGLPVVSTVHGFTGGGFRNRLYERLQRLALRRADTVVAVSRPLVNALVASGVAADRVRFIPNGWDGAAPLSRAEARRRLDIPAEATVVGWVGRLTSEKGPDVFTASVAELRNPTVTASVVGDGRRLADLQAQAHALGIAGRMRWHGRVADAGRLMAAFDVFVLSSRTEGTPIALFEAMAARVPIVATAVGGVPDVVTAGEAVLVPSDDAMALAAAIDGVLASPGAAAARAAAAADRLARVYSAGAWLDRYEEVYANVRNRRRPT